MIEYPDYEAAILERQEGFEIWEDDPDSPLAMTPENYRSTGNERSNPCQN